MELLRWGWLLLEELEPGLVVKHDLCCFLLSWPEAEAWSPSSLFIVIITLISPTVILWKVFLWIDICNQNICALNLIWLCIAGMGMVQKFKIENHIHVQYMLSYDGFKFFLLIYLVSSYFKKFCWTLSSPYLRAYC